MMILLSTTNHNRATIPMLMFILLLVVIMPPPSLSFQITTMIPLPTPLPPAIPIQHSLLSSPRSTHTATYGVTKDSVHNTGIFCLFSSTSDDNEHKSIGNDHSDSTHDDNNSGNSNNNTSCSGGREPLFYNDFEDFSFTPPNNEIGNDDNDYSSNCNNDNYTTKNTEAKQQQDQLSLLLSQSKQTEIEKDIRLSKNWSNGNWKVRGFTLDKFKPIKTNTAGTLSYYTSSTNNTTTAATSKKEEESPIHVCKISFDETIDTSQSFNDITETMAVARTDGSVYIIQLGSDYITKFKAIPKKEQDVGNNDINIQLIRDDVVDVDRDEGQSTSSSSSSSSSEINEEFLPTSPFEILYQFYANFDNEPITSLLYHDEIVYTSSGSSGDIQVWSLDNFTPTMSSNSDTATNKKNNVMESIPVQTLKGGHSDKVVVLKSLSNAIAQNNEQTIDVSDHNLLLSASVDGSFALWSRDDGDLVYKCQLVDDYGNPTSINCADIDTSSTEHFIYFGLSSGHVVGYAVTDLVGCASEGNSCPIPSCRFLAHDPSQQKVEDMNEITTQGISAIVCAGEGTTPLTSNTISNIRSNMIITGGVDGLVKQYEIYRRKNNGPSDNPSNGKDGPSWTLEYWPRMSTQRMKRHAHVFKGHYLAVTALASNGSKILSAGRDGTVRVWESSTGLELYRMDGFKDNISSVCMDREILVTDGMGDFVCVHDFDIDVDEYLQAYDLDW